MSRCYYTLGLFTEARAGEMINTLYPAAQEVGSFRACKRAQRAVKGNIFPTRVPGGFVLDTQAVAAAQVRAVITDEKSLFH